MLQHGAQMARHQAWQRFPGMVRTIRKRIGDPVTKDEAMASIESNQSLTSYELKSPLAGTVMVSTGTSVPTVGALALL